MGEWLGTSPWIFSSQPQPEKPSDLSQHFCSDVLNDGVFSNHGRRWCRAICRNTLDGCTYGPSQGTNTHTERGKGFFLKYLMLIYSYHSASFIIFPLPRPLRSSPVFSPSSLSVRLRFIRTMSSHLPSVLLAGSYFLSVLSCVSDTGHWEKMHFQEKSFFFELFFYSPPPSPCCPPSSSSSPHTSLLFLSSTPCYHA